MIVIDKTVISDDIADNYFVCDISKCKGGCCVEGDLGAPLEDDEIEILENLYDKIEPYLNEEGKKAISQQGKYVFDEDKEYSTPTINGKECAYAIYDDNGILKCGIEKAWEEKAIKFRKPISCHLYPIRVTKYDSYNALNYDRWDICIDACALGKRLKQPLYVFLKEPLIRKFGRPWYNKLLKVLKEQVDEVKSGK